jgi:DNA polymerase III epsilon subunit-like protein
MTRHEKGPTMKTAILFDCEFLCTDTSINRFWCGPYDPDPTVVQIGAVRLGLEGDFPVLDTLDILVAPQDRSGNPAEIDPFLTRLTGLTPDRIAAEGLPLATALARFDAFSEGAPLWSWGKDEIYLIAISCFVHGIEAPIPAPRFHNLCAAVIEGGMPYDDVQKTRSNALAAYFGIDTPDLRAHDGLDDALSVTYAIQHLLRAGRLDPAFLAT